MSGCFDGKNGRWNCCRFTWQVFEKFPESYLSPNRGLFEGTWMVGLITEPLGFVQDARDVMVLFGGSIVFVVWTSPLQGRRLYVMTAWCRMEQAS